MVRGIRGAVQASANSKEAIYEASSALIKEILERNQLDQEQIISIFVTSTPDLDADFPAYAIRSYGLDRVPVLGATELAVPGAMTRLIRMMLHVEVDIPRDRIRHVYLGPTATLRPDLAD
jgi:chorismate mutase